MRPNTQGEESTMVKAKSKNKPKAKKARAVQLVFEDPEALGKTFEMDTIGEINDADKEYRDKKAEVLEAQKELKTIKKALREVMLNHRKELIEGIKYYYRDENDERREVSIAEGVVSRKVKELKTKKHDDVGSGAIVSDSDLKDDLEDDLEDEKAE